ncbi:DNA-primase RepB domain-containing protein [Rhodoferax sp.]|uniref:DNA-primase RepB domain-containing protein n=1 Tax=Rhodoferax sp. TaxID=50421 RepID=UPI002747742B|nr:DNA-primase RepB domain-containing protein [Rhodoferax sp.]
MRVGYENPDEENPVAGEEKEESGRGSDVVRENFEFWRGRRLEFSKARLARHQQAGATSRPWRPDGRPRLREWHRDEDGAPARPDASGAPVLIGGDQGSFFEIRAFAATLDAFHDHQPGHTTLSLIQPGARGRILIFAETSFVKIIDEDGGSRTKNVWGTDGSWCDLDWQKIFHLAWAKSKKLFEEHGSGEQIFAAPGEKSRMILVDDLKTPVPIFDKTLCIILETSSGNYQHLYCVDRVLTGVERHHIQKVLAARFGGDPGATGGAQPHRVPGSTNYKKGRDLFVCRLAGTVSFMDGGKPLKVDNILRETPVEVPADQLIQMEQQEQACKKVAQRPRARGIIVPPGAGGGDASASGKDWRNSIIEAAALRAGGLDASEVTNQVKKMLLESARRRGKNDAIYYANRTVLKLTKDGHL